MALAMATIVPAVSLFVTTVLFYTAVNGSSAIPQCRSLPTLNDNNLLINSNDTAVDYELNLLLNQTNASGSAVVLQAIITLQRSGVFGNDNGMLRRIAYAETRDGTRAVDARASNAGGIWAVSESKFLQTQDIEANVRLPMKLQQIEDAFGIDWLQVEWEDLRIPLYSVIAARLVLYVAPRAIPSANDLQAQARFWVENYNPAGDEDEFIGASSGLQGIIIL